MGDNRPLTAKELRALSKSIPASIFSSTLQLLSNPQLLKPEAYGHDGANKSQAELQIIADFLRGAKAVSQTSAFARLSSNLDEQRHCVRCHGSYAERQNSNTSCVVPHVFDQDLWEPGDACEQFYPSICCGEDVVVKGWGPGDEETFPDAAYLDNCFHGKHTDDPKNVRYNGKNTRRCYSVDGQVDSCARKHLKRNMFDGPCWEFYCRPQHSKGAAIDVRDQEEADEESSEVEFVG